MTENIVEAAVRNNVRVQTVKGMLGAEGLYDLTDLELNQAYITLEREMAESQTSGLMQKRTRQTSMLELKMKLVEHVYNHVVAQAEAQVARAADKRELDKLTAALARAEESELNEMGTEAILERIAQLKNS